MSHSEPVGSFALVLHSHLPWLAHHGSWPVGEEWLYQSWASSYLPVMDVFSRLAAQGRRNLVTLGVTPILAAQLDDPYCVREFGTWLGFWSQRADQLARSDDRELAELGQHEALLARERTDVFERHWQAGGSAVLRPLVDSGAIELLSGPAAHPFQPLLDDKTAEFSLSVGRDDTELRLGSRPGGIWAPECGYRAGLEDVYQSAGVTHFMVDGPTLLHVDRSTADAWTVHDSDVVAFGRDLEVTYRVWSPRKGYPGGPWYRDFHTFNHDSGIRHARVTSSTTASEEKAIYQPEAASAAVVADARDFVELVRSRLLSHRRDRDGTPGLVVAGYDTELFGHWWHEGPQWLELVLRQLPRAGVTVTTLSQAMSDGAVAGVARPSNSSWGSGKDWSVWAGPAVDDIVSDNEDLMRRWRKIVDAAPSSASTRDPVLDQIGRDAILALSSDWAFMVTKDSAANYARGRHDGHHHDFNRLASAFEAALGGDAQARSIAIDLAANQHRADGPFGHLDGRFLASRQAPGALATATSQRSSAP
jgi:1,4-alpha-glucan branching enzyme